MYWGNKQQRRMRIEFLMKQYAFLGNPGPICPYFPDGLDLDISNRCNLACISCFHSISKFSPMKDMSLGTYKNVLRQAKGRSSTVTIGNHGEPFLHKYVFKMLRLVKSQGFFLNLITNGTLLSRERAERLLDLEVDRLVFSLDSVDPKQYPLIRKNGNLRCTLRNILYFLKINFEKGLKTYVNISMVNTNQALRSKINIFDYFSKLPVHVVYTSPILNFHDLLAIKRQTKFHRKFRKITDHRKFPVCLNGFDRLLIRPNGNVSLCGIDWNSEHILGNVNQTPYYELWNNRKAQEFRKALISRDYSSIEKKGWLCSKCDVKWACSIEGQRKGIVDVLSSDLRDLKGESSGLINSRQHYENLLKEIKIIES